MPTMNYLSNRLAIIKVLSAKLKRSPLRILALPMSVNYLVPLHMTVMLTIFFVMTCGSVSDSFLLWKVKSDIIQCIHLCFCMLAISFYFVNCVIISCKLSFNSRFTRNQIPIMSFLGFKKAELGCKMSELHLYVVKRQNWVVIIRK